MNNWLIGSIAVLLWLSATLVYLRRPIGAWFGARRMRRKMLAEARAKQQDERAAAAAQPQVPPGRGKTGA